MRNVLVNLDGRQVNVTVESGGLGAAMSVDMALIQADVVRAESAASAADASALEAATAVAGVPAAIAGKLDVNGSNVGGSAAALRTAIGADLSSNVNFTPAGTGAVVRTIQAKARDIVSIKDFGAAGDGVTNDTAAFVLARAYVESLPRGGEIYFPAGRYKADLNLRALSSDFEKRVTVRGAGRGATQILPTADGVIMLNMLGRNRATICDLTLYSGDNFAAACGVYMARSTLSGDCNGNKFINVEVAGNFTEHAVINCAAESGLWLNCRIAPNNGTADPDSGFWAGTNPALCGVTPPLGTPVSGPCTDNRMIACETYIPYDNARHLTFSTQGGWVVTDHAFIGGTSNGQRFITYTDAESGVFNGPIRAIECHYEVFGTNNVAHFIDNDPNVDSSWYGIVSTGGYAVIDNNFVFLDFNRQQLVSGGPLLSQSRFEAPALPPGITAGMPLYINNIVDSKIYWRARDANGLVVVLGFAVRTPIEAVETRIAQLNDCAVTQWADSEPSDGTYARGQRINRSYGGTAVTAGDQVDWVCSQSGTFGSLATTANMTAGSNVITVADATGIKVGQFFYFGSQVGRVAHISGNTVTMTTNALTTGATEGTGYAPGGSAAGSFYPVGVLGILRAAAQANSAAADVAALVTDFNALLAKLRTANLIAT